MNNITQPQPSTPFQTKKLIYLFLMIFLLVQVNNLHPLSSLKSNSLEFKFHFVIIGLICWIFAAMIMYTAYTFALKPGKLNGLAVLVFGLLGLCMLFLPFYLYLEISSLDHAATLLNMKADSLRKIGR